MTLSDDVYISDAKFRGEAKKQAFIYRNVCMKLWGYNSSFLQIDEILFGN